MYANVADTSDVVAPARELDVSLTVTSGLMPGSGCCPFETGYSTAWTDLLPVSHERKCQALPEIQARVAQHFLSWSTVDGDRRSGGRDVLALVRGPCQRRPPQRA